MTYQHLQNNGLFHVEQTMTRYCVITEREYTITWRHIPSYYLDNDFKVYVN